MVLLFSEKNPCNEANAIHYETVTFHELHCRDFGTFKTVIIYSLIHPLFLPQKRRFMIMDQINFAPYNVIIY